MQRFQDSGRGADEIGQRREVEVDTLPPIALALPVERLMLAVLLEQDHRQQAGADPAPRDDMEGRRGLGHRRAVPAAELLTHGLPHEPAARDDVERLGDGLADLRQSAPTAAGAARRRREDDPLARQMLGQWPAGGLLADMRGDDSAGLLGRSFGSRLVLGRALLELGQLQLELVEQPCGPLAGLAERLAPGLGEQQLQSLDLERRSRDQRLDLAAGLRSARIIACAAARSAGRDAGSLITPECKHIPAYS